MENNFKKEFEILCISIAEWLNKKIDIPNVPEFVEAIIFNKAVKWIANYILNLLKKAGGKNV